MSSALAVVSAVLEQYGDSGRIESGKLKNAARRNAIRARFVLVRLKGTARTALCHVLRRIR